MAEVIDFKPTTRRAEGPGPAGPASRWPALRPQIVAGLLLLVAAYVVLRAAWITDDAYITLRTVDNFVHGHGLRWNAYDRVQAFTHPLWMFVLSGLYVLTDEAYYTTIVLSIVLSLLAVWLSIRNTPTVGSACVVGAALVSSKAFIDYTTSGLENPLSYLLVALFLRTYLRDSPADRGLFWLFLIAGLATLNRMDALLLYLPALVYVGVNAVRELRVPLKRVLGLAALGFLPFLLWEVFSVVYYGYPFPNTAYAKLGAGIDTFSLARQGVFYFGNSLRVDPVTLPMMAVAALFVAIRRDFKQIALVFGIVLYLLYVIRVGGDFMSGRFFALPFFAAVVLLGQERVPPLPAAVASALIVALGFFADGPTFLYDGDYSREDFDAHGISDERGYYYQATGLLRSERDAPAPDHIWVKVGRRAREAGTHVTPFGNIGFFGYYAGPAVYVVDPGGLADPLLGHIELPDDTDWRIGHFSRPIPVGYLETVAASLVDGPNQLRDPKLHEFYDKVLIITRGPIWSLNRFVEILKMNLGFYDRLVESSS